MIKVKYQELYLVGAHHSIDKQPQGIQKQHIIHKNLPVSTILQSQNQSLSKSNRIQKVQTPSSSQKSKVPKSKKVFILAASLIML